MQTDNTELICRHCNLGRSEHLDILGQPIVACPGPEIGRVRGTCFEPQLPRAIDGTPVGVILKHHRDRRRELQSGKHEGNDAG